MTSRRDLLIGTAGLIGAAATGWAATPSMAPARPDLQLDLDDPATNLRAYIKLRGSLDERPVYDSICGSVYGLVAGQPAQPLFKTAGAQRSVYARRSALEYSAVTRYVGLLLDWETEQPLQVWTNPFTGEDCKVPVTRYGPSEVRFLADRMVSPAMAPAEPPSGKRHWFALGGVVHMLEEIMLPTPGPQVLPKADLMTFSGDWRQLADPGQTRMPARLSFNAVEPWRDWMGMQSGPPGTLWWHVAGVKLDEPGHYAPEMRAWIQSAVPDFFRSES